MTPHTTLAKPFRNMQLQPTIRILQWGASELLLSTAHLLRLCNAGNWHEVVSLFWKSYQRCLQSSRDATASRWGNLGGHHIRSFNIVGELVENFVDIGAEDRNIESSCAPITTTLKSAGRTRPRCCSPSGSSSRRCHASFH